MAESYDEYLGSQHSVMTTFWLAQTIKPKKATDLEVTDEFNEEDDIDSIFYDCEEDGYGEEK